MVFLPTATSLIKNSQSILYMCERGIGVAISSMPHFLLSETMLKAKLKITSRELTKFAKRLESAMHRYANELLRNNATRVETEVKALLKKHLLMNELVQDILTGGQLSKELGVPARNLNTAIEVFSDKATVMLRNGRNPILSIAMPSKDVILSHECAVIFDKTNSPQGWHWLEFLVGQSDIMQGSIAHYRYAEHVGDRDLTGYSRVQGAGIMIPSRSTSYSLPPGVNGDFISETLNSTEFRKAINDILKSVIRS